ncbi:MAG: tyrosine--tRNA ligase [Candidatus Kuenenbacteria bacterium]
MPVKNQVHPHTKDFGVRVKIDELLTKGVENIYPSREFLEKALKSGKKLTIYQGFDPTANSLHIGHAVGLIKLKQFQELGHQVIFLIGDYTALIGDPDKKSARKPMTREEIMANCKDYQKQAASILDFEGKNKVELKYNSQWLSKLTFAHTLGLLTNFTVQRMLERDLFEARIKSGNPLYIHEFMYPVMQAYDCVSMEVDGEIGGNDQTFNMLAGRTLMKAMKNKEKFVLTTKLLIDSTGKKMGKTEGNMITLSDSPKEMFGKIMSWPDTMIALGFELCTHASMDAVRRIEKKLKDGKNPRDLKAELAREIISIYYSMEEAKKSEQEFNKIFRDKDTPDQLDKVFIMENVEYNIADLIMLANLSESKAQAKRLVEQGAVKLDKKAVKDWKSKIKPNDKTVLQVGKRKFAQLNYRDKT